MNFLKPLSLPGIASLTGITPDLAIDLVKQIVDDHCKHKVNDFELQYHAVEKRIDFKVFLPHDVIPIPNGYERANESDRWLSRLYKLDDPKAFCDVIELALADHITNGDKVDYVIIKYIAAGTHLHADCYYTDNKEEKQHLNIVLK